MPSLGKVENRPLKYVDLFLTRCGWSNLYIPEKEIMALKTLRIMTKRRAAWLELWKNMKELKPAAWWWNWISGENQAPDSRRPFWMQLLIKLSVLFSNGPWRGASTPSMSLHNSPALRIDLAPVMMITMMTMMMVMMMMITMMIITLRMLLLI